MLLRLESLSLDLGTLSLGTLDAITADSTLFGKTLWDVDAKHHLDKFYGEDAVWRGLARKHHLRLYNMDSTPFEMDALAARIEEGSLNLSSVQSLFLRPGSDDADAATLRLSELLKKQGTTLYFDCIPAWSEESLVSPLFSSLRRE